MTLPTYAIVTPVRDEADNLRRLAASLAAQTCSPQQWIVVDTGSTDATAETIADLRAALPWLQATTTTAESAPARGGPIVRALVTGVEQLTAAPDVIVKLDADLSFERAYFERLMQAFASDPDLGMASGICTELEDGEWRPIYGTRSHVWGAARSYRWACWLDVSPLEERQGWDEVDAIKAQMKGWKVRTLVDLPFCHHRPEGTRDGMWRRWRDQGDTAFFMGYRFSYLLIRTAFRAREDLASLAMLVGYASAAVRRAPRCDAGVRGHLRTEQDLRRLPRRVREALGRAAY